METKGQSRSDAAIKSESIGSARQRRPWFITTDFGREDSQVVISDIGRIGNDEVETAERSHSVQGLKAIGQAEPHSGGKPKPTGVAACNCQRLC